MLGRFWSKVSQAEPTVCWPFTGARKLQGYGLFSLNGRCVVAHRVAWEQKNGPIPQGVKVLHRCDNPPCCNPAHLFLGTQAENVQDMIAKDRQRLYGKARLSEAEVVEILVSREKPQELAVKYGVSMVQVYRIKDGTRWAKVTNKVKQTNMKEGGHPWHIQS